MSFAGFGTTAPSFGAPASTFGAPNAATFGGFGGTPTTFPSLSTTAAAPSFGTTGSTTTTSPFGGTAPPALSLGGTSAPNPFGAFGTTSTAPATTTPANPFAMPSTTSSPFGTAPTLTLGSSSTPSPFGSGFGTSATTTAPVGTPSLFGASTPTFGTTFGTSFAPTTTTTTPTFFSPQPASATASSFFGAPQPPQPQPTQPTQQTPLQKMEVLYCCFNPAHPQCKFRHMFYNQINASPEEVKRMNATKPPQVDQLLWEQACRNNPDPSRFVPVQACGFEELKQRIAEQNKLMSQQSQTLQDATKVIDYIKLQHTNNTMAKLDDYKRRQLEISQRVIRVICKLMVLEARGTRLTAGEEQLKRKFEMILLDLTSPILYRAKIEDFIALSRISVPSTQLPQLDDKAVDSIAKALKEQRAGLEVLTSMVQKDSKDVQLMMNELNSQ